MYKRVGVCAFMYKHACLCGLCMYVLYLVILVDLGKYYAILYWLFVAGLKWLKLFRCITSVSSAVTARVAMFVYSWKLLDFLMLCVICVMV